MTLTHSIHKFVVISQHESKDQRNIRHGKLFKRTGRRSRHKTRLRQRVRYEPTQSEKFQGRQEYHQHGYPKGNLHSRKTPCHGRGYQKLPRQPLHATNVCRTLYGISPVSLYGSWDVTVPGLPYVSVPIPPGLPPNGRYCSTGI